jgi:adenine C2-methylase RlmN of 23S rRNA A2503 and tRNA A37
MPIAFVAAAVSTGVGIRDQDTLLSAEAQFIDGESKKAIAQVVRKGTGEPLENDAQAMKAGEVKSVIDGWASDMYQAYVQFTLK